MKTSLINYFPNLSKIKLNCVQTSFFTTHTKHLQRIPLVSSLGVASPLSKNSSTLNHDPKITSQIREKPKKITLLGTEYTRHPSTNITPRVSSKLERNLHLQQNHPLNILSRKVRNFFYSRFLNRSGNPLFSVYDRISPVVSTYQNFDSLLVPDEHPSRSLCDSYYINKDLMLRSHTSAHQEELIRMGLDCFIVIGDVYRRDEIDCTHYPVFHQLDATRLFDKHEVFKSVSNNENLELFQSKPDFNRRPEKQEYHTLEAVKIVEHDLKSTMRDLMKCVFGKDIKMKWVDAYFPFTHPSWELMVEWKGDWLEVLGCGILEQQLLRNAGAGQKISWAFGLGLERIAMPLYSIPDIRLFWSDDPAFLEQFDGAEINKPVVFKPFSQFPRRDNDISFWVPTNYNANDFYELVREVGGDLVERVQLIDRYEPRLPETRPQEPRPPEQPARVSYCYRISYRDVSKPISQAEVDVIHQQIRTLATERLQVQVRVV